MDTDTTDTRVIRATFLETEAHYRTAWEHNPKRPRIWLYIVIIVPLVIVATLPDTLKEYRQGARHWWLPHAGSLFFLFLVWLFALRPTAQWRLARAAVRKHLTDPPTEAWAEFSESGFLNTSRAGMSSFHPWSTIPEAFEFDDGLLFYIDPSRRVYLWFPKSGFAAGPDFTEVLLLSQSKVASFSNRHQ